MKFIILLNFFLQALAYESNFEVSPIVYKESLPNEKSEM